VFILKIAIKLRKTNALNFEHEFLYKEIENVVKIKEFPTLKLLIAINLNVYQLFLKELLITIDIAYEKFEVIKLLIKEYSVTLKSYLIYVAI